MDIYPAIDLLEGFCVRLNGGDYNESTIYSRNPIETVKGFESAGAKWVHLVDLDGARNPACRQKDLISTIISKTTMHIQTGGGMRNAKDIEEILNSGAHRVILGSLSVKDPRGTTALFEKFSPDRIVLALDVKGDFFNGYYVATYGWKSTSDLKMEDFLDRYKNIVQHILCTDISRDGKLGGPNTDLYKFLSEKAPGIKFQASGGVATVQDLEKLKQSGVSAAIVGKALYEKKFSLSDALTVAA